MIKDFDKSSIIHKDTLEAVISNKQNTEKVLKFDLKEISLLISKSYGLEFSKNQFQDDDFALIFRPKNCDEIDLIDLETYRKTSIKFSVNDLINYCGCLKIAENKFFVYGGYEEPSYVNSTKIIDVKAISVESLPSDSLNCFNGLCLFNESIYCFGGYYLGTLNNCKKFDIKKKVWINIQSLPQANHSSSASTSEIIT